MTPAVVAALVAAGLLVLLGPILAVLALLQSRALARRVAGLAERLDAVEGYLVALYESVRTAGPAPVEPVRREGAHEPAGAPAPPRAAPAAPSSLRSAAGSDLEALVGGRILTLVGALATLLAAAFFLKLAYDQGWLGPETRFASGLLAGAGLLVASGRFEQRFFADGLAGLGAGILYLSLYAAGALDELLGEPVALGGMAAVTLATAGLALRRRTAPLAHLALLGGLVTPLVLPVARSAPVFLFSYLACLNAVLLLVASRVPARGLVALAVGGTALHFWGFIASTAAPPPRTVSLAFATALYLEFVLVAALESRARERLRPELLVATIADACWYLPAVRVLLEHDRAATAGLFAALALVHLLLGRRLAAGTTRRLLEALALTFATLVAPALAEGRTLTIAWAAEGALLVRVGLRTGTGWLRLAGGLLLALVLVRLVALPIPAPRAFWNGRLLTFAAGALALADAARAGRRRPGVGGFEAAAFGAAAVAANGVVLLALSLELWQFFAPAPDAGADAHLARRLALSVLWAAYGTALFLVGLRRDERLLRWQAFVVLGLATLKVFLVDLAFLARLHRVVSLAVLGLALLAASYLYQKRLAGRRSGEEAGPPPSA